MGGTYETERTLRAWQGYFSDVLLAEWRDWWARSGEQELRALLTANWDVLQDDPEAAQRFDDHLLPLARHLHEGATRLDVQVYLRDVRSQWQPSRYGRKWNRRDQRVSEKVFAWYRAATGE